MSLGRLRYYTRAGSSGIGHLKQLSLTQKPDLKCGCTRVALFLTSNNRTRRMNSSFLRKRKMSRGVLVLDGSLASIEPHLKKKNFHVINLPEGVIDAERKELVLS